MGTASFLYRLSRLTSSSVAPPSWVGGSASHGYTFDDHGNITSVTGTNARSTPTSATTNRLTGAGVACDAAGNLTVWNGTTYQFDKLNRLQRMTTAAGPAREDRVYIYTADDERFWSLELSGSGSLWTLRDLSGNPVRQFQAHLGWSKTKDSIYRDGQLLAADHPDEGVRHYHLDHLGTPRLTTNPGPNAVAHHTYFPFGEELSGSTTDGERLKFTGHERDLNNLGGAGDDLDYMQPRFHSPVTGRFLSTDPSPSSIRLGRPQSWNRYSYALGNPVKYFDPDGESPFDFRWLASAFGPDAHPIHDTMTGVSRNLDSAMLLSAAGGGVAQAALSEGVVGSALSQAFRLAPIARGNAIEAILGTAAGGALPRTFPVIDRFLNGVATSVKSIDLAARAYQNVGNLTSTIRGFVNSLANFKGAQLGNAVVEGKDITSRVLEIVVQKGALTVEQANAIAELAKTAQANGVLIKVIPVK